LLAFSKEFYAVLSIAAIAAVGGGFFAEANAAGI
jgi:hypothetical protein